MTGRISVTPELQQFMRDFANGLGVTYDEAIRFMLSRMGIDFNGDNPIIAGNELRKAIEEWQQENPTSKS